MRVDHNAGQWSSKADHEKLGNMKCAGAWCLSGPEALKRAHTHTRTEKGRWINRQKAASGALRPRNETSECVSTAPCCQQQLSRLGDDLCSLKEPPTSNTG